MKEEKQLEGLGGWLILVGIGVVIGPLRMLATVVPVYRPLLEDGTLQALTTPGTAFYNPWFLPLITGEITVNAVIFVASLWLIYLYFSRHHLFPRVYIAIAAGTLLFILVDAWVVSLVFPQIPVFDPDTVKEVTRASVQAGIWVPYMLLSRRVALTFVKRDARPAPAPEAIAAVE